MKTPIVLHTERVMTHLDSGLHIGSHSQLKEAEILEGEDCVNVTCGDHHANYYRVWMPSVAIAKDWCQSFADFLETKNAP